MRILWIGNSYTYYNDLPAAFAALAAENGRAVTPFSVTKGGYKLYRYLDPADECAPRLDEALSSDRYDAVFLQEQSLLPVLDYEAFLDGVTRLSARLKDKADRVVLYETWGRKEGSLALEEHGLTRDSMTAGLSDAYARAAKSVGAEVAPVGQAFLSFGRRYPEIELYNADRTHPSKNGTALAAVVQYRTLFSEFPTAFASLALDTETEAALRAWCLG